MNSSGLRQQIFELVERYFENPPEDFRPDVGQVRLNVPSYGAAEVNEALDCMLSSHVTMGKKVAAFEADFARYMGVKHALFVNSGSSANLLALAILANPKAKRPLQPGDEVIVPAVTWSTTLWPVINMGCVPVLVDVDPATYNLDPDQVEAAITERTRAIFVVHLLGNPAAMDRLTEIARRHDLILLEDTCESMGCEFQGQKVGTFGLMGTYSTYFSHHMTTIEGGLLVTNDDEVATLGRILRSHGWTRHLPNRTEIEAQYPHLDPRFLFVNIGYNLRGTDVQAAFGLHQLKKLDGFNVTRVETVERLRAQIGALEEYLEFPVAAPNSLVAWFGFPFVVKENAPFTRAQLIDHLEAHRIETRPIVAGNLAVQPALELYAHRTVGTLPHANRLNARGVFFANHGKMTSAEVDYIATTLNEFCATASARPH